MDVSPYVFGDGDTDHFCRYDEKLDLVVHCFGPGECRCKCGGRIVRRTVKKQLKTKFGRQAHDPNYKD